MEEGKKKIIIRIPNFLRSPDLFCLPNVLNPFLEISLLPKKVGIGKITFS